MNYTPSIVLLTVCGFAVLWATGLTTGQAAARGCVLTVALIMSINIVSATITLRRARRRQRALQAAVDAEVGKFLAASVKAADELQKLIDDNRKLDGEVEFPRSVLLPPKDGRLN